MWQKIFDFTRQVFTLTGDTKKTKEDVKALQQDNKELRRENTELRQEMNQQQQQFSEVTRFAERMMYELQRTRESAESDKKMLRMEMELLLLRAERRLPPAESAETVSQEELQQIEVLKREQAELQKRIEELEPQ